MIKRVIVLLAILIPAAFPGALLADSIRATVEQLTKMQVRVHCLALGGVDLTSSAGKMTMAVIAAIAEFERDLLVERTQAGLKRAKAQGKKLGRPTCLNAGQLEAVSLRRSQGASLSALAKDLASADRQFNGQRHKDWVPLYRADWNISL